MRKTRNCTSLLAVVALSFELGASTRANSQPVAPLVRFETAEAGGLLEPVTAPRVRITRLGRVSNIVYGAIDSETHTNWYDS